MKSRRVFVLGFFIVSLYVFLFIAILGTAAQERGNVLLFPEKENMKVQASMVESGTVIYVDATIGDDVRGIGTSRKPYKTISKALGVAQSGATIMVGPGTYSEYLNIDHPARINIIGSGSGSSIISGSVYAIWCEYLKIQGFKIMGGDGESGLWCDNIDQAEVRDCIFEKPNGSGIVLEHNSAMWVYNSQINCVDGQGVISHSYSYLWLENCSVDGGMIGIVTRRGALTYVTNSTISNNSTFGAWIEQNAEFWMQTSSFFGNMVGIRVNVGGVINCVRSGESNKIFNNTQTGILLETGGTAELSCTEIYGNPQGILVQKAGVLDLIGNLNYIHSNTMVGIEVKDFAHAFLGQTEISGNALDVSIHDGGQAKCNPVLIGTIASDCIYCKK